MFYREILGLSPDKPIKDPCLPLGMMQNMTVSLDLERLTSKDILSFININLPLLDVDERNEHELLKLLYIMGTGKWQECFDTIKDFTKTSEPFYKKCQSTENTNEGMCPDDGIHLPSLLQIHNSEFYGFSEFWYTMDDVLHLGGQYTAKIFQNAAEVRTRRV